MVIGLLLPMQLPLLIVKIIVCENLGSQFRNLFRRKIFLLLSNRFSVPVLLDQVRCSVDMPRLKFPVDLVVDIKGLAFLRPIGMELFEFPVSFPLFKFDHLFKLIFSIPEREGIFRFILHIGPLEKKLPFLIPIPMKPLFFPFNKRLLSLLLPCWKPFDALAVEFSIEEVLFELLFTPLKPQSDLPLSFSIFKTG